MYYFTLLIQLQFLPKVKSLRNSGIFSWNIDNLYFKHNGRFPKKFHYLKKKKQQQTLSSQQIHCRCDKNVNSGFTIGQEKLNFYGLIIIQIHYNFIKSYAHV